MENKVKVGVLAGLLMLAIVFCIQQFTLMNNKFLVFSIFLILILSVIASVQLQKRKLGATANFGSLFSAGFATTATATMISVLGILGLYAAIPSFKERELAEVAQAMANTASSQQIQQHIADVKEHFYTIKSSQYIFPFLMTGALFSAIASFVFSRKTR
jgi:pyridoxal biosynthesis lyase PdxS